MNTTDADVVILEIEKEISSERYERVEGLVDEAYEVIIDIRSSYTTLEILRRNTAGFFIRLFTENWKSKLGVFIVLAIIYFLFRTRITHWHIKNKMAKLEVRRTALKGLIKGLQRDYFEYGKIPEGVYNLRTKKFAEMIRDIDRQIPLFNEKIARLSKNKKIKLKEDKGKENVRTEKKEK